jgi:predicted RND superfamily exporter protein
MLVALMISLSFTALIGAMSWIGLTWNAFTLPALLLSLGTGSDYFIHVILDLKNHRALTGLHQRLFRPLLLCASTSAIGFGSLLLANSTGLANLGLVCALALVFNATTALGLMPWLWQKMQP